MIFIITIISSPLLKYISPSAYEFINNLYSHGGQWITYPGILWLTGWFVHALLEALLLVLLSFGLYSVPTNLPQFIINWIHKLDTESKSEIKAIYLQIYLMNLKFVSAILLVFVFISYLLDIF